MVKLILTAKTIYYKMYIFKIISHAKHTSIVACKNQEVKLCSVETKRLRMHKINQVQQETAQAKVRLAQKPVAQELQNQADVLQIAKVVRLTTINQFLR